MPGKTVTQLVLDWGSLGRTATQTWLPTQGTLAAQNAAATLGQGCLCVYGPEGAGKSHFLAMLKEQNPNWVVADDAENWCVEMQETLFHAFNAAVAGGNAIVVASRKPVAQLGLLADLKSRLLTGLQVEMTLPDDAELAALLQRWAEERQLVLPDAVATYVLARAERNPHVLAALVAKLDALSLEQKRAVTIPLAKELGI